MSTRSLRKFVFTSLLWGCAAALAVAEDWPAYKHDATRSSVSSEQISTQLRSSWTWHGAAPKPAWGEPGRSFNPLDFDYAPQPVVANGIVFLACSADDSVRAFDATSGELKWTYTCDGPVRFAPQIVGNQCFFAADDGIARCLDAATGEELWRKQLALNGSQVIANGRLSSRWPCRSGVLVKDGKVFVTAGMWPSEGVYIFCLEAKTGKELWCNDTSCYEYLEYPHVPSVSFGGAAPQGALLATDDTLVVPTGRGVPAGYDLATGKLLHYRADSEVAHKGGTWATVLNSTVFVNAVGWMPDVPPRLGESPEHFADSLMAVSARTGKEEWQLSASMKTTAKEWQGTRWRGQISAGLYGRTRAIITDKAIYAFGNGKADAYDVAGSNVTLRWSMPLGRVYAEALCANQLIVGMDGGCSAIDPATGKQLWTQTVSGQVRGLAIVDGRVFATTSLGTLHVFSSKIAVTTSRVQNAKTAAFQPLPTKVADAIKLLGNTKGFALVIGGHDARLAQSIAGSSLLNVVQLMNDPQEIAKERDRLLTETNDYGQRISVLDASKQPLPPYFASLVVLVGDRACMTPAEGYRVLRPCGGVLCAANSALPTIPNVLPEEKRGDMIIRGPLPRSFDWEGKVEADERVRWPLEFSWFGEPSSQLQKARHTRPRSPLPAHGRLFVFGENTVTAVDAYSGTLLWKRRLNDAIGKDAPVIANDTSFSCSLGSTVATFDAASGRLREIYSDKPLGTPIIDATKPVHLTGAMRPGASCEVEIESTATELRFILTAKNNAPQPDDAWELAFDFRQPDQRLNARGPGTFELVVNVWNASLRAHPTFPHPASTLAALEPGKIQMSFAWADIATFAGWKPTNFSLAADCKLWSPKLDLLLWDRPLTNGKTRGINDAEAIIIVSTDSAQPAAGALFPLQLRPLADSPIKELKQSANGLPLLAQRRPNADLSDFGAAGVAADSKEAQKTFLPRATGFEFPTRNEPFTGTTAELDYTPSYGCSGIISSATMDFLRSGCIGMYDREDDSGMRNISGIRSGCGQTIMPALGMLLYAEGTGNCLCTYNYATSFGMAPTDQRRNEDWALFNDTPKDTIGLSHVAFNLGAPGDRRADDGTLWLAIPRPGLGMKMATAIPLPVTLEYTHGEGPQRINTDRNKILFTDKPWIYGSNVTGIKNLHVDLTYYKPGGVCLSVGTVPPTIDGNLNDACWDGFGGAAVGKDSTVWVRHDADHLYLASKPSADSKSGPLNLTFADPAEKKLISLTATGGKLTAKALEIPPYDPKASFSSLPEVPAVEIEIPGVNLAGKGNYELAIPWKTFTALGLDATQVRISGNPISFFGRKPPDIKRNFTRTAFAVKPLSTAPTEASYTLRLHFCDIEPATTTSSNRVFDVLINGKPVLEKFDLTKDVGRNKAVMKEFNHVPCGGSLDVEFRPADKSILPVLSGIEIIRE